MPGMKTIPLHVKDAYIVEYPRYCDHRGFLEEIFNVVKYPEEITKHFQGVKQNTIASSHKNVLRGTHISPYAKLMTCVTGSVYDVLVDLRSDSPTYLKWAGVVLSADNGRQLLVPPYCGHGYFVLEEGSTVVYVQGGTFDPPKEAGISPLDDVADIHWPLPEGATPIMSEKDTQAPFLASFPRFPVNVQPKRTRFLVVGASGQVGGAVMEALQNNAQQYVGIGTYNEHPQDFLVPFSMETAGSDASLCEQVLSTCYPHVVCICAAFSWVDGNEKFPEKARKINVDAVLNIAKAAKAINAKVVFYSSDYVFDGEQKVDKLSESMSPNPLCSYGKYKLEAEKQLLSFDPKALVLRISRVFGPEIQGKNFVFQICKAAKEGRKIPCLTSEVSCPTYNRDIAAATLALVQKKCSGIFHCAGPEPMSKDEWGRQVTKLLNIDSSVINPVDSLDASAAKRPKVVPLATANMCQSLGDFKLRTLEEALKDWKNNPRGQTLKELNNLA